MEILLITALAVSVIPLVMLLGGRIMALGVPSEPNCFVGYRTALSMSSAEAWNYANRLCGKLWKRISWPLLAVSIAVLFIAAYAAGFDQTEGEGGAGLTWIIMAISGGQIATLLGSILYVERRLRETFNADGTPRQTPGKQAG